MKFTVKSNPHAKPDKQYILTRAGKLEFGNTHDSAVLGLEDEEVEALHKAGLISLEGKEDNEIDVNKKITLKPKNMKIKPKSKEV